MSSYDVLIVGAGAAGLAASCVLTAAGLRVAIVEARDRIGGRIFTQHATLPGIGEVPVEAGAEFIHGLPANSWNLICEAQLDTYELDGSQLCFEETKLQLCSGEQQQIFTVLARMSSWLQAQRPNTDLSFAEYLRGRSVEAGVAERAAAYVEGFNAADRHIAGIAGLACQQKAEDLIEGDRIFHIKGGYEGLPRFLCRKFLAQGGALLLDRPVSFIRWRERRVSVGGKDTAAGDRFDLSAEQVLLTLPLGVLQAGAVQFEPALHDLAAQASRMKMGVARRVSLVFKSHIWREAPLLKSDPPLAHALKNLSFLFARETHWPTWWTAAPDSAPIITAWAAGPKAAHLDPDRLVDFAIEDLSRIFSVPQQHLRAVLVSAHCHDWQADPFSRGAYSYVPAGSLEVPELLARPRAQTLFFAGEHTDLEGHWGTVHAALHSGVRAAHQLLQTRP